MDRSKDPVLEDIILGLVSREDMLKIDGNVVGRKREFEERTTEASESSPKKVSISQNVSSARKKLNSILLSQSASSCNLDMSGASYYEVFGRDEEGESGGSDQVLTSSIPRKSSGTPKQGRLQEDFREPKTCPSSFL